MTEAELENVRLKLKIEAIYVVLRALCSGLANTSPSAARAFRETFAKIRHTTSGMTIPGLKEGYSDMMADEYHQSLDDLLAFIEEGIRKDD